MSEDDSIEHLRNPKANMDHIYNQADPRAYFSELNKLDYATPGAGKPFFLSPDRASQAFAGQGRGGYWISAAPTA